MLPKVYNPKDTSFGIDYRDGNQYQPDQITNKPGLTTPAQLKR